ncbi:hypothetical protein ACIPSE_31920 [Streptomyces sp. NPDC090106]|uniref:hypothetical protein n=1 Tax=Streptomyces sp. NPDC090106 TaxID=3365946 RepID=UPI003822F289
MHLAPTVDDLEQLLKGEWDTLAPLTEDEVDVQVTFEGTTPRPGYGTTPYC